MGPRCSCGSRRQPLRRLARRGVRTVLAVLSFTGLSRIGCSPEQLAALGRWNATFAVGVPCCPRTLLAPAGR